MVPLYPPPTPVLVAQRPGDVTGVSHWRLMRACALTLLFAASNLHVGAQGDGGSQHPFSTMETLHYSVEWHLINAGTATLRIEPVKGPKSPQWDIKVQIESAGVVSRLFKLDDTYTVHVEDQSA